MLDNMYRSSLSVQHQLYVVIEESMRKSLKCTQQISDI